MAKVELKVGDKFTVEFEVARTNMSYTECLRADGRYNTFTNLDDSVIKNIVRAPPPKPSVGQVWKRKISNHFYTLLFVNDKGVLFEQRDMGTKPIFYGHEELNRQMEFVSDH